MSVKTTADRLMAIPCKGYWDYTPDGNEFDCEYPNVTDICEHCVCNIGNCYSRLESHRNTFNPITGKRVGFKVVKRIFAIVKGIKRETGTL